MGNFFVQACGCPDGSNGRTDHGYGPPHGNWVTHWDQWGNAINYFLHHDHSHVNDHTGSQTGVPPSFSPNRTAVGGGPHPPGATSPAPPGMGAPQPHPAGTISFSSHPNGGVTFSQHPGQQQHAGVTFGYAPNGHPEAHGPIHTPPPHLDQAGNLVHTDHAGNIVHVQPAGTHNATNSIPNGSVGSPQSPAASNTAAAPIVYDPKKPVVHPTRQFLNNKSDANNVLFFENLFFGFAIEFGMSLL